MPADTTGTAVMTFQKLEHNFGVVKAGEKVGCIFPSPTPEMQTLY